MKRFLAGFVLALNLGVVAATAQCLSAADTHPITHAFLACGAETRIIGPDGSVQWRYPHATRDGWVLPDGDLLLTLSRSKEHPGGAVIRIDREGRESFHFEGTQEEVNTAQWIGRDRVMLTEAGPAPRLLEVDGKGRIRHEIPLQCQTTNIHLQSRMARRISGGHYLVPQLLDRVVREYNRAGEIVSEIPTPHWPFTAIRMPDGHTLINCTRGNLAIEVDRHGRTVWQLTNEDLPFPLINDACGGQRLPNGNTVIAAYAIGAHRTKLFEVTPAKKVVWSYTDDSPAGIHHFQILDTNGRPLPSPPRR